MTARITKKECQEVFKLLAKALGKSTDVFNAETKQFNVGAWKLDYNAVYGGAIIQEIINEGGGVTDPVLRYRLSPREFVTAIGFALRVLDIYQKEHENETR